MPTYSTIVVSYIILQSVSVLLLLYLIIAVLKSKPFFTKWTLFQIYISAFGQGATNLPLIMIYGDNMRERAFETPLCIVLQKLSNFFLYPLQFSSCALAFYLWYALFKNYIAIEEKCLRPFSIAIWIYTTFYNGVILESSSKEKHWAVIVGDLNCKTSTNVFSIYGYIVQTCIIVFLAVLMSCHSAVILYRCYTRFSSNMNRRTAIKLGEAARVCTWCIVFVITLILPLVPRIIQKDSQISGYIANIVKIANFSSAAVGTVLFLIFGTDRKVALFLPCYYLPPDTKKTYQISIPEYTDESSGEQTNFNGNNSITPASQTQEDSFVSSSSRVLIL